MTELQQANMLKTQMLGILAEENIDYVAIAKETSAEVLEFAKALIDSKEDINEKGAVLIGLAIAMIDLNDIAEYVEA